MPPKWTFFQDSEVEGLDEEFVSKLDMARKIAETPFIITSGFRTPKKNLSVVGSVPDSSHLKGLAVDLRVETSHDVWKIVDGLQKVGITRIGIYVDKEFKPIHIHCDVDPEKVSEVIFIKQEALLAQAA